MKTINERFSELRKSCKKTQSEWGKILGISRSGVADIEGGRRKVTNKHLIMLSNWGQYNINIDWLQNGTGNMFLPTENNTLETIRQEYNLTDVQFKFISEFLKLPIEEKNIIFDFLSNVFVPTNMQGNTQTNVKDSRQMRISELYAEAPKTPAELEAMYPTFPFQTDPQKENNAG